MRRIPGALMAALLLGALAAVSIASSSGPAYASPVASSEDQYQAYGRVFPDPQGCLNGAPGASPYAKGNICAVDFIQLTEAETGLKLLEDIFPRFVKYHELHRDFGCNGKPAHNKDDRCKAFKSAGLPHSVGENGETYVREKRDLRMIRVTDESVPNKNKKYFVFPMSIHGIERAGVEGGLRAAEDLATWGACEADAAPDFVDCAGEVTGNKKNPYPLLEAGKPDASAGALKALRNSVVYFMMPNPDGWLRGDRFRGRTPGTQFYQRYNGNGVDLNRDWPTQGYTFRPYTPWSEPESRAFGKVLPKIGPKDKNGDPNWTGGIDLHGQLIDRAFSFTLMGAGEHKYSKNQRILQVVKGAWRDAEARLAWSPAVKPNDAPDQPADPRVYGVQWGTVWDTIDYTITGGVGDWINNESIGLGADGIDNEMSLSHLSNCGIGTCWSPDVEQLHVDGNKSLVYSMINYSLKPEPQDFETGGRVGYVHNRGFVSSNRKPLGRPSRYAKLDPQKDIKDVRLNMSNDFTHVFNVGGPKSDPKAYNGGIEVKLTCATSPIGAPCELSEAVLQRKKPQEPNAQGDKWETVNSYFLQGVGYSATGKALHANLPTPGKWRVRVMGGEAAVEFDADINFTSEKGWPDPGQLPYKVSSMRFWKHLKKHATGGLERVNAREIKKRSGWKKRFDTIVITNRVYKDLAGKLKKWVAKQNGNLVLTDKALGMLRPLGFVDGGGIDSTTQYAGYINFATEAKDETYKDPLAKNIDQAGAAEGGSGFPEESESHRHQTYEPVPIGYSIQDADGDDQNNSPVWHVANGALTKAAGKGRAVGTTGDTANVSLGEIKFKGGSIRFVGAVLPDPSDKFDHPYGLANYALTYSGYQLLENLLNYKS